MKLAIEAIKTAKNKVTDLGSLIVNIQNVEISGFSAIQILSEINSSVFAAPNAAILTI